MYELPPTELLQNTHTFPGPYMFKVIGRAEKGFQARVIAAVREELAGEVDPPFKMRGTADGKHIAITLEPQVETADQVLAVYRRLRPMAGLIMLW